MSAQLPTVFQLYYEGDVVIHQLSGVVVESLVDEHVVGLNQSGLAGRIAFVADSACSVAPGSYFYIDGLREDITTCMTFSSRLVTSTTVMMTPTWSIRSTRGSSCIL